MELKDIRSEPVGYMGIKEIFPLDFMEFIINMGVSETIISNLRQYWDERKHVDSIVHEKMLQLFRLYLIVGGMPAAVVEYKESNNISTVTRVQRDIIDLYRKDISQYAQKDKLKIKEVFDLLPSELEAKNKRFILKNLNEDISYAPIYMIMFIKPEESNIGVYKIDLSGLV